LPTSISTGTDLVTGRERRVDIVVLGAGSATSSFVSALRGSPSVVVFEHDLVGGECPYDACIPSKSLLHDGAVGRAWSTASGRRRDLIDHRDDRRHATALLSTRATA
jgi:dihydrolipoamide dehydrogenase